MRHFGIPKPALWELQYIRSAGIVSSLDSFRATARGLRLEDNLPAKTGKMRNLGESKEAYGKDLR
jgi:hypothetical protein